MPESEAVELLLGHEKLSMSYRTYSIGLGLPALRDIIEKVTYPKLDLSHLYEPQEASKAA